MWQGVREYPHRLGDYSLRLSDCWIILVILLAVGCMPKHNYKRHAIGADILDLTGMTDNAT